MTHENRDQMHELFRNNHARNLRRSFPMSLMSESDIRYAKRLQRKAQETLKRVGLGVLGCAFLACVGVAVVMVLVTISLYDALEYITEKSPIFDRKE